MKLSTKVLLILASMMSIILLFVLIESRLTLVKDYEKLDIKEAISASQLSQKVLGDLLNSLKILNGDWSQWDDAYVFMTNKNQKFINSNIDFTTFQNSQLNYILFLDNNGKLFFGRAYDLTKNKFVDVPVSLIKYFAMGPHFKHVAKDFSKLGILKIPEGYFVFSALPILTSKGEGPPAGIIMMGYLLTAKHIQKISDTMQMGIQFFSFPLFVKDSIAQNAISSLEHGQPYYVIPENNKFTYSFWLVKDINEIPIAMIRIEVPRLVYNEGIKTISHFILMLIAINILVLVGMWYLFRKIVTDRVVSLNEQVKSIYSGSQFSSRIKSSGNDELAHLSKDINFMLEIIELTQEQLKYRISQRTEELKRLTELNQNLHEEVQVQKEIEKNLREGEKELKQIAYYDVVTFLPNRRNFHETLNAEIKMAEREKNMLAILFIDIDKFKLINDNYGHEIGDKFLRHIAEIIKDIIKETDIVARLAGDEFIALINNVKERSMINDLAQRILNSVAVPLKENNELIHRYLMI